MIKPITSIILATSLIACSSDGDDTGTQPVSLTDMSGVWDISSTDPSTGKDEAYMVVSGQGSFIVYDYMGDEYNNLMDCYQRYSFFGPDVQLEESSDNEFYTLTTDVVEFWDTEGSSETSIYYKVSKPSANEMQLAFERSEVETDHVVDGTRIKTYMTIDFSVENEISMVFRINTIRSSATYSREADGSWSATSENIMHDNFSFDSVVNNFEHLYSNGSLPEFNFSKYSGSESDFSPVCSDTLDAPQNTGFSFSAPVLNVHSF